MDANKIVMLSEYNDLDKYMDNHNNIFYCKKNTNINHNPYGPAVIRAEGTKEYWIEGKYHRLNGPAIIGDGYKVYYIEGKCHRLDGPAVIYWNGKTRYYINGLFKGNTKEEFYKNFYNDIEYLFEYENITTNKQDKINILNIKNCILNGLDSEAINIINSL